MYTNFKCYKFKFFLKLVIYYDTKFWFDGKLWVRTIPVNARDTFLLKGKKEKKWGENVMVDVAWPLKGRGDEPA